MKVVIFAFAHHDNVLSYADPLARYTDLDVTVILIGHGNKNFSDSFEEDLSNLNYGLTKGIDKTKVIPAELRDYFSPKLKLWVLKLAPRKVTAGNFLISYGHLLRLAITTRGLFDVYHFNGVGLYSLFLSSLLRFRNKILTIHDYIPHSGEGNAIIIRSNRKLVRNFDHFIQHYDYLSKEMAGYFKVKESQVYTVRQGTFDFFHQFAVKASPYSNYILFFGRISPYKGLKYLVEAFVEYCRDHADLDLVIAGGGDVTELRVAIDNEPRIHLLNRAVPNDELSGLIQGCKCVVLPYTDVSHSGVILHAYTYGKPVIAHNLGGLHEVILQGKTGLLVDDLSKESIINGILSLPKDTQAEQLMRSNIDDLTQNGVLSWKNIAQEYRRVYSLVNEQPASRK